MLKGEGYGNKSSYINHIGGYFFFISCAGVSIIAWLFNCICWYKQCCCFDYYLNKAIKKRLIWWIGFIFLLGILACCISGFVTINRFGFALDGSWCAFDRLYYDSLYGQLKEGYPKWEGFEKTKNYLINLWIFLKKIKDNYITKDNLLSIYEEEIDDTGAIIFVDKKKYLIKSENFLYDEYFTQEYIDSINELQNGEWAFYAVLANQKTLPIISCYGKIVDSVFKLNEMYRILERNLASLIIYFDNLSKDFSSLKISFLEEFYYYIKIEEILGKLLSKIYFCLLCISVIFAGASMIFYVLIKRQRCLRIFMHILWNIFRIFIFSYFFYGTAFGISYLSLRDAIAYVMYVFGEENLSPNRENSYLIPMNQGKDYLHYCLINNNNDYKNRLDLNLKLALEDFFNSYSELREIFSKPYSEIYLDYDIKGNTNLDKLILSQKRMIDFIKGKTYSYLCGNDDCGDFPEIAKRHGGIFGFLDCSFLKSDLHMMFKTVFDLSVESQILCVLSCCIGFFSVIFIYFFLLILHHYNEEISLDIENKNKNKYEIELSTRREETYSYNINDD